MVAQMTIPKSMKRVLNYNEKKVQQGKAELIHAQNFLKLPEEMNFYDKMERFEKQMELNDRAQTKTIHISLNFPPEEKEKMTKEMLITLADEYMEKIGFGNQPYLVYQHHDSGHPHVHVVSTLIRDDGSRINTHHLGKDVSDPARKELEIKYNLISSNKKQWEQQQEKQLAVSTQKIQAGQSETMRSITNVLHHVIDHYKYTSLQELNALLKQYNVKADRGAEDGRIYKNRGLMYMVVDADGKALTKPIKASAFHSKPTLDYIESKFKGNEQKREPHKKHLKTAIDWAMQSKPKTLAELAKLLQKDRMALVIRRNEQERVYGMTYIDHEKKTVFNGSDLGKEYSAKRMLERLGKEQQSGKQILQKKEQQQEDQPTKRHQRSTIAIEQPAPDKNIPDKIPVKENDIADEMDKGLSKLIEQVIEPDYGSGGINRELTEEEKRKRRKQQQREL